MVVPLAARWIAAAGGMLLVLTGWQSVIGTLIVPRPVASWLTRMVDRLVVAGITLTYEEFLAAVARMREVGFPITREPAEAWPDFVGWRVNYENPAYRIAAAIDAVPALWSGPRRHGAAAIAPRRPPSGRQRPR